MCLPHVAAVVNERRETLISYFGPSGHGKGLVDAMSGFGVTNNDFSYRSAEEIYTMLNSLFANDEREHYKLITLDEFAEQSKKNSALPIPKCQEKHMFAFFPDGSVQAKINMCSCLKCLRRLFVDCPHEKGCLVYAGIMNTDFSDYENTDEDSDEEKDDVEEEDCTEAYELRSESVLDIIQKDSIIALYSPSKSIELFFLFKVLEFGVAESNMVDRNEHYIMKGEKFIKGNYLEKTKEKKGAVFYKITNTEAYVLH